jgi:hypothetical protein
VEEFLRELDTLKHTNCFLNQTLGPGAKLLEKLPEATQKSLSELESFQQRQLAEFSRKYCNKPPEELLAGSLDIMRKIGQSRTDLTRENLLKLNDFMKLEQLDQFLESPDSGERGFLRNDLELRRENLKKQVITSIGNFELLILTQHRKIFLTNHRNVYFVLPLESSRSHQARQTQLWTHI